VILTWFDVERKAIAPLHRKNLGVSTMAIGIQRI
jgi:hypothetical protein